MSKQVLSMIGRSLFALLFSVLLSAQTRAATFTVHVGPAIAGRSFVPELVSVQVGDTVEWVWDSGPHSVTSGVFGLPTADFDSGQQDVPFTFSHVFGTVGTFPYFCQVHGVMMTGSVEVVAAPMVSLPAQKDNTLYEDATGQLSNGQGIYLFMGQTGVAGLRRGLIAFDLTSIPANATITGATLSMTLAQTHVNPASVSISLSKASHDWGEGASNAGEPGGMGIQAQTGDATWLHTFYDTSFWTTPGGDFSPVLSATTPVTDNGPYTWSGSGLLADVQSWVSNPAGNFGWVILGDEVNAGSAQRFNSSENASNPPQLTVTYQIPSPTPTPTSTPTSSQTPTPTPASTATPTSTPGSTATPTPSPVPTSTPTFTPTPTPTPATTATPTPTSILGNISTRLRVETGDNVLIGGFIVAGTQPKKVIVRAIGPSLPVTGALANPFLELHNSSGSLLSSNDNWRSDQEAEIIATTVPPSNDLESAIVATLPANGSAYTAIVRGVNEGTGIGLVEAYDLDRTVDSKLANISTRGLVQTDDNVLIGGLIVQGQAPLKVIVRAIGPSLPVVGALANPTLELHDGNGAVIASNDNWRSDQEAEIIATTVPPSNDLESAIVRNLAPGTYTAIVRGVNNTTGVALVEVYALN